MYYVKKWFMRRLFKILRRTPLDEPMVDYWRRQVSVSAKQTRNKDGAMVLAFEGEKEIFPGFPRGHILFTNLSKLKHEIKNQIFNESWVKLEQGIPSNEIVSDIKEKLTNSLGQYLEACRYDLMPLSRMNAPIKEIWRVLTEMEGKEPKLKLFKEILTFILQEDDGYRFRVQWITRIWPMRWINPIISLKWALEELEHGEVIGDMKDRQRLLKRILLLVLEDPKILELYKEFCRKIDWSKLKMTPADKYHFRAKYFKVDFDRYEY